jgi:long-chain acyl-CoA synthetase
MLNRVHLARVVASLVASELKSLRPGATDATGAISRVSIDGNFAVKDGPLAIDSLEFMTLATAVAGFFGFFDAGHEDTLLRDRNVAGWLDRITAFLELARPSFPSATDDVVAFTFTTSGSTGTPQRVRHPAAWLNQEVAAWAHLCASRTRVVLACPAHHIYGCIWGVLLPQMTGLPVLDVDVADLTPNLLRPGDLLVTVPPVWSYLGNSGFRFADNVWGVSSTAPLPPAAAQGAASNGLARLLEIYGSTETAGVAWRNALAASETEAEPYELLPHWQRTEIENQCARHCVDGKHRLFNWPDLLNWQSSTHFTVLRRHDGAVQIGGHNVSPAWVQSQILTVDNVADCAVRTFVAGADIRIKVFIVLRDDTEQTRHNLVFALRQQLPSHAQPKLFAFGAALPINEQGKPADWAAEV